MISSDEIADLFGFNEKSGSSQWLTLATVVGVDSDSGKYTIALGNGKRVKAVPMCNASRGSRVMVAVINGAAYAIAAKG